MGCEVAVCVGDGGRVRAVGGGKGYVFSHTSINVLDDGPRPYLQVCPLVSAFFVCFFVWSMSDMLP